jgi:hypothetical protein
MSRNARHNRTLLLNKRRLNSRLSVLYIQEQSDVNSSNTPRIERLIEDRPKILAQGVIDRVVLVNRLSGQSPANDPGILALPLRMTSLPAFIQ